jgi:hypothetical protein
MTIPFGNLRLNITLTRAPDERRGWEVLAATGMDDRELARLNAHNTRDPVGAPWEGFRLMYGAARRH